MNPPQPVTEIIRQRYSCRTYAEKPVRDDQRVALEQFLAENKTGPFKTEVRFGLIGATPENQDDLKDLGTYGVIRNPAAFIVGAVKPGPNNLEDFGYAMEKNILFATSIGLGTCWLGGTFTKSTFAEKIEINYDEFIPAVTSLGQIAIHKSLLEKAMRWSAGADNRKAWEKLFFKETFAMSLPNQARDAVDTLLEMVRIGPSASNRQPWRIVSQEEGKRFHFYMQRSKGYLTRNRVLFNLADLQRVDMGIAMCHFEMTACDLGLSGKWCFDEPDIGNLPERTSYVATWEMK